MHNKYKKYKNTRSITVTRKLSYSKDDRAMRPIHECPKILRVPDYAHGYFSRNCNGLLFQLILRMSVQNLKFVTLPIPDIIGGTPKIWAVPGYARAPFLPKIFIGLLFGWTLWMYLPNLKSVALPVPKTIRDTQKIWTVPGYAHAPFSPKFFMGFCSDGPCECIG